MTASLYDVMSEQNRILKCQEEIAKSIADSHQKLEAIQSHIDTMRTALRNYGVIT